MRSRSLAIVTLPIVIALVAMSSASGEGLDQRLKQVLKDEVCQRNGYASHKVEIKMHRTRIPARYDSATDITVTLPEFDDAIGPMTARAQFRTDGVVLGSIPVPVRVDVYDSVLITTRKLKRHHTISRGDLRRERLEISKMVKWVMSDIDSVAGSRAARTINPGSLVDRRWVEVIPIVLRGDHVTLEYEAGGVRVTANATAMEDGYPKQTIRVKTEYANKLIDAVVTGRGTVSPVL